MASREYPANSKLLATFIADQDATYLNLEETANDYIPMPMEMPTKPNGHAAVTDWLWPADRIDTREQDQEEENEPFYRLQSV